MRVLGNAGITVFAQDRDLKYRWIKNPPTSWNPQGGTGADDASMLPGTAAAAAAALKRDVIATGRAQWGELMIEGDRTSDYFDIFVQPERDISGAISGILGLAIDVSDRRKQAATLEAVGRDLSHRSKNLLAIIQSLATHTARNAGSPDAFIEQFRGRIQSISRSQDLSIGATRRGARLSELVGSQVSPYLVDAPVQLAFRGLDCHLSPNAALHVGLALYELCIDSVRAGALSIEAGRVDVAAERLEAENGAEPPLRLVWAERDGPTGPEIEGFALLLLQRVVPASVGGSASFSMGGAGRRYELTIAGNQFWD